jgi:large subunit ribosomal protein L27
MAHKKGVGSTDNGRDSNAKRLGIKLFGGQLARAGNILIRQRGTRYHVGPNTYLGRDHTVHAQIDGRVTFYKGRKNRTYVSITPLENGEALVPSKPVREKKQKPVTPVAPVAPVAKDSPAVVAEAPVTKSKPATSGKIEFDGKKYAQDDLTIVEGIGPKISEHLKAGGVATWSDLAAAEVSKLQEILDNAGPRYRVHNPSTWAKQSQMVVDGKWDELKVYQDRLDGGVEPE